MMLYKRGNKMRSEKTVLHKKELHVGSMDSWKIHIKFQLQNLRGKSHLDEKIILKCTNLSFSLQWKSTQWFSVLWCHVGGYRQFRQLCYTSSKPLMQIVTKLLGVKGRTPIIWTLKWILKKYGAMVWSYLVQYRSNSGGLMKMVIKFQAP